MAGTGEKLTAREVEVTRLVILGLSNAEIGRRVFLSEDTVKTHLRKAFKKVGALDRAHLITLAWQHELVPRDAWEEQELRRGSGPRPVPQTGTAESAQEWPGAVK